MQVVAGGANSSLHSLLVAGTVSTAFAYPWAGVMFSPGQRFLRRQSLVQARHPLLGQRRRRAYRVMLFTASGGRMPATQTFTVTAEWKEYKFPLSAFNGTDGHDIMAIIFVSSTVVGAFSFQLDDVRLD